MWWPFCLFSTLNDDIQCNEPNVTDLSTLQVVSHISLVLVLGALYKLQPVLVVQGAIQPSSNARSCNNLKKNNYFDTDLFKSLYLHKSRGRKSCWTSGSRSQSAESESSIFPHSQDIWYESNSVQSQNNSKRIRNPKLGFFFLISRQL